MERSLQSHFSLNLEDQFPTITTELRERLAETMVLRRRRILYRRARYEMTLVKSSQVDPKPANMPTDSILGTSQTYSKVKSAITLEADDSQSAYSPSVSLLTTYFNVNPFRERIPPPPQTPDDPSMGVTCPYCLNIFPSHAFQRLESWRYVITTLSE